MDSQLMRDNRSHDCNALWVATKEYEAILQDQMHPMVQTVFPHYVPILQDANTSQHTAKQIQKWFHKH